jgi:hypothetical protein
MPYQDANKKDKKRFESKTAETVVPKSAETETSGSPQITVLQLRPKSNYAEWVENNENYFSHTYGKHGEFFETMERYRPPVPKRPTVRETRSIDAVATAGSSSSGSNPARITRARPAPSRKPEEERKAPDSSESESNEDDSTRSQSIAQTAQRQTSSSLRKQRPTFTTRD